MEQIPDELRRIGELLRTQDNRCTDSPVFIVQQQVEHPCDPDREGRFESTRVVWYDRDECGEVTPARAKRLEELHKSYRHEPQDKYDRVVMGMQYEYVQAFFTHEGAQAFLDCNGHNLKKPRIYADGSYRNAEFRLIRDWLMSLSATPPAHGHRGDWYLMANARRIVSNKYQHQPNWVLAKNLFATGSTSAHQICVDAGIDPYGTTIDRATQPS
jgi:hypothetical protein